MAFVYTLTNAAVTGTDPAGTDPVSQGDDNIRAFKSAMIERVNSRFVDVNADPWIIKSPSSGGNTQSLVPTADNTYTLGTGALRFSDVRAAAATFGAITGPLTGNVTGNLTGTVLTAAQANITSLGVLTGLTIGDNTTATPVLNLNGTVAGNKGIQFKEAGANVATLFVASQLMYLNASSVIFRDQANGLRWTIDSTGLYPSADNVRTIGLVGTRMANVYSVTFTGNLTGNVTGNLTGTILTAAQANITSLGTLTSLTVSGALSAGATTVSSLAGLTNLGLGAQTGAQLTLTKLGAGAPVSNAAQTGWYQIPDGAAVARYVPTFT